MCTTDAGTLRTIGGVSTGIGTFAQMYAARNAANYQASVANQNAAIADAQSVAVGQAGAQQQAAIRQQAKQVAGSQKAGYAASGLDVSSGSALDVLSNTAQKAEQDVQTSQYNTMLNMWGLNQQAKQYRQQAEIAKRAGKMSSWSSLLTGVTSLAKQYQQQ